jgi:hypothetical protein
MAPDRGLIMDPNELIKAAPEIAKGAGALAAAIPFTSIVKKMLGPAADELAEMWRDQVRLYRYERQLKCVEKAEKMAQDAGFTPKAVPIKLLFPILEGASFEENENLHTMWAALLANAANSDKEEIVRPGFLAILKQMAPDEAALLMWISDKSPHTFTTEQLMTAFIGLGFAPKDYAEDKARQLDESSSFSDRFYACRAGLVAEQLITSQVEEDQIRRFTISTRGRIFVRACRPPMPSSATN